MSSWLDEFSGWIDAGSGALKTVKEAMDEGTKKESTSTGPIIPQQSQADTKVATEAQPETLPKSTPSWLLVVGIAAAVYLLGR